MRIVLKYPFEIQDNVFAVRMPVRSKVVLVEIQGRGPCIWVEAQEGDPLVQKHFAVYGTGHPIALDNAEHVASFQDGIFVWHLYSVDMGMS